MKRPPLLSFIVESPSSPLPQGAMGFTHLKNESKFSNLADALRWAARVVGFCAKHMNRLGFSFSPPAKTNQMCECRSFQGEGAHRARGDSCDFKRSALARAAGHIDEVAGHVGGFIGQQPHDRFSHLMRGSGT